METCKKMIKVYYLGSLNVSASQTFWYNISLFGNPLLNFIEVFEETKYNVNIFHIHVSSLLISSRRVSHLSKIFQNESDIVSIPSLCTFTCNEALYTVHISQVCDKDGRSIAKVSCYGRVYIEMILVTIECDITMSEIHWLRLTNHEW